MENENRNERRRASLKWTEIKLADIEKRYSVHKVQIYRWIHDGRLKPESRMIDNRTCLVITAKSLSDFEALGGRWHELPPHKPKSKTKRKAWIAGNGKTIVAAFDQALEHRGPETVEALGKWLLAIIETGDYAAMRAASYKLKRHGR